MADQDPPIEPLRRLDPAEPDEQGLGRLERLDPEAEEPQATSSNAPSPATPGSRVRDGLSAAITLAVLLSLSSIAAIGGLVAISMGTAVPAGPGVVESVETGVSLTTIRVGESAQGLEEEQDTGRADAKPQVPAEPVDAPAPVPQPPSSETGGGGVGTQGGGNDKGTGGGHGGKKGSGGGWCDAREGGACDVVAGGSVLQPGSEPEGDGFVSSDDQEDDDDDAADDDDDDGSSSGSGRSHHPGKGHGH